MLVTFSMHKKSIIVEADVLINIQTISLSVKTLVRLNSDNTDKFIVSKLLTVSVFFPNNYVVVAWDLRSDYNK